LDDGGEVIARLFLPEPESPDGPWGCRYEISDAAGTWGTAIFGADSLQSVVLAARMVAVELGLRGIEGYPSNHD
jgi:hypothetical protein